LTAETASAVAAACSAVVAIAAFSLAYTVHRRNRRLRTLDLLSHFTQSVVPMCEEAAGLLEQKPLPSSPQFTKEEATGNGLPPGIWTRGNDDARRRITGALSSVETYALHITAKGVDQELVRDVSKRAFLSLVAEMYMGICELKHIVGPAAAFARHSRPSNCDFEPRPERHPARFAFRLCAGCIHACAGDAVAGRAQRSLCGPLRPQYVPPEAVPPGPVD